MKRVAIVAVHGVADQKPNETAHDAAAMLAHSIDERLSFTEGTLHVRQDPVRVDTSELPEADSRRDTSSRANVIFTREKLAAFEPGPADAVYNTCRLTARTDGEQIDVYEVYWGDISRAANKLFRVAEELYLFLFFLCRVPRTIFASGREYQKGFLWWMLRRCTWVADQMITLFIPALNLCLLLALAYLLPYIPGIDAAGDLDLQAIVHSPYFAVALLCVGGYALYRIGRHVSESLPWAKFVFPLCLVAVAAVVADIYWWHVHVAADTGQLPIHIGVLAAEVVYRFMIRVWSVYLVAAFFIVFTAWLMALFRRHPDEKCAVWTVQIGVLVPGLLTLVLNLSIWYALSVLGLGLLSDGIEIDFHTPQWVAADSVNLGIRILGEGALHGQGEPVSLKTEIEALNASSSITVFPVVVCLLVIAVVAILALLPSIRVEGKHPFREVDADRQAQAQAQSLGDHLSRGFNRLGIVSRIFLPLAVISSILIGRLSQHDAHTPISIAWQRDLLDFVYAASWWTSFLFGMAVFMLVGMFRDSLFGIVRMVVDIANDVANWLRKEPLTSNPTSRIASRYVSLLNRIENSPDGDRYDVIIILAHSLGTLVTVDLLRFLNHETRCCPAVLAGGREVHLVTFGSPLQQLLGLRFPYRYGWCRDNTSSGSGFVEDVCRVDELAGVDTWTNCYCSGDFVGRYLWHADDSPERWSIDTPERRTDTTGRRREICLGPGGHTGYMLAQPGKSNLLGEHVWDLIHGESRDRQA